MQMLNSFRSISKIRIVFVVVLCITKMEERVARRIDNAAIVAETAKVEDETQGFDLLKSVSFFRTSVPMRIYECLSTQSLLRCMKIYVLQKMEAHKQIPRTGNLTRDFLDQFFGKEGETGNLFSEHYSKLSDQELSKRLVFNFQQFFKNSDIKLHFLPGIIVKIIPSSDNKLKFSLKKKLKRNGTLTGRALQTKEEIDGNTSVETLANTVENPAGQAKNPLIKKRKNKKDKFSYKNTILQIAVPIMAMPAILLGSILPFLLPVLKMATIMTLLMNNSAFIAALIYAARTHANAQEEQHISYGSHPVYSYH